MIGINKIKTTSVNESVYIALKKDIITLELTPGTTMSENYISQKMKVSRQPVREAFIKLSHEGLVDIFPQKGTSVSKINLHRVEEQRFLRASLELNVIDLFFDCKTNESIIELQNIIEKQKHNYNKGEFNKILEYDNDFHYVFFRETNKTTCWNIVQNNSGDYLRMRLMSTWFDGFSNETIAQHTNLLTSILNNDDDLAKKILRSHLSKLEFEKDEMLKKYPDYFL